MYLRIKSGIIFSAILSKLFNMAKTLTTAYLNELQMEYTATHKCLERIPENLFNYKPHPKSMELGYLAQLVAAIPLWIKTIIEEGEIDLATFPRPTIATTQQLLDYYEKNYKGAKQALEATSDEALKADFSLKAKGESMYTSSKLENIMTTLNHWVHHRGQLTVYMRLNDIAVPSIYGPSADDSGPAQKPA